MTSDLLMLMASLERWYAIMRSEHQKEWEIVNAYGDAIWLKWFGVTMLFDLLIDCDVKSGKRQDWWMGLDMNVASMLLLSSVMFCYTWSACILKMFESDEESSKSMMTKSWLGEVYMLLSA